MNLIEFTGALEIGLIYAFVAFGVYLTFRVINFPDLTVDGSFPLGAAITAVTAAQYGIVFALVAAFITGAFSGLMTALLNVRGKIMDLLAGILSMGALYSINLRIMGKPNIALALENNVFDSKFLLWVLILFILIVNALLVWFLSTRIGLAIRATGINERASQAAGVDIDRMKIVALSLSNGMVALGGSVFALSQGFADISMGTGTIIIGLASVIIGERIFKNNSVLLATVGCVLGSIIYRLCIALALNADFLSLEASDINLITSIIVASALILPRIGKQIRSRK